MEAKLGSSFNHLVGKLVHISGISLPDISYACMRFSGYMACHSKPIFEALHHTLCHPLKMPYKHSVLKVMKSILALIVVMNLLHFQMLTMLAALEHAAPSWPPSSFPMESLSHGPAKSNPSPPYTLQPVKSQPYIKELQKQFYFLPSYNL
jgi:hypothetical protein